MKTDMKTDRELLELAAMAAGIKFDGIANECGLWAEIYENSCWGVWNPLQDDGDALRLAVKCEICITSPHQFSKFDEKEMIVTASWYEDGGEKWVSEIFDGKDYAESLARTRRAITRAAAQIQLDKEKKNA